MAAPPERTAPGGSRPSRSRRSRTMELLLDVDLPVSISFGKTQLPLKDVLKLTTGSIVELNRGVNDQVEVLVNQCLIARGEVVVVEGNYGVRIQESPAGRTGCGACDERACRRKSCRLPRVGLLLAGVAVSLLTLLRAQVRARARRTCGERYRSAAVGRRSRCAATEDRRWRPGARNCAAGGAGIQIAVPRAGLNLDKRSQALRMHRRGEAAARSPRRWRSPGRRWNCCSRSTGSCSAASCDSAAIRAILFHRVSRSCPIMRDRL